MLVASALLFSFCYSFFHFALLAVYHYYFYSSRHSFCSFIRSFTHSFIHSLTSSIIHFFFSHPHTFLGAIMCYLKALIIFALERFRKKNMHKIFALERFRKKNITKKDVA